MPSGILSGAGRVVEFGKASQGGARYRSERNALCMPEPIIALAKNGIACPFRELNTTEAGSRRHPERFARPL
jgi:hypothetical protein